MLGLWPWRRGLTEPPALTQAEMRSAHSCESQGGGPEHRQPRHLLCGLKGMSEMS